MSTMQEFVFNLTERPRSEVRDTLVDSALHYLLFFRGVVPCMPVFDKHPVNRNSDQHKPIKKQNVKDRRLHSLQKALSNISDQLTKIFQISPVYSVCIVFGSSVFTPKEIYKIEFSQSHWVGGAMYPRKVKQLAMANLISCGIGMAANERDLPRTKCFIMIHAHRTSAFGDGVIARHRFSCDFSSRQRRTKCIIWKCTTPTSDDTSIAKIQPRFVSSSPHQIAIDISGIRPLDRSDDCQSISASAATAPVATTSPALFQPFHSHTPVPFIPCHTDTPAAPSSGHHSYRRRVTNVQSLRNNGRTSKVLQDRHPYLREPNCQVYGSGNKPAAVATGYDHWISGTTDKSNDNECQKRTGQMNTSDSASKGSENRQKAEPLSPFLDFLRHHSGDMNTDFLPSYNEPTVEERSPTAASELDVSFDMFTGVQSTTEDVDSDPVDALVDSLSKVSTQSPNISGQSEPSHDCKEDNSNVQSSLSAHLAVPTIYQTTCASEPHCNNMELLQELEESENLMWFQLSTVIQGFK